MKAHLNCGALLWSKHANPEPHKSEGLNSLQGLTQVHSEGKDVRMGQKKTAHSAKWKDSHFSFLKSLPKALTK